MGEFKFTLPDGSTYNATADTWEEAQKGVSEHISQEKIDAAKKKYDDASVLGKIHMKLGDPLTQVAHGITAGLFDKGADLVTGGKSSEGSEEAAARIGPTGTAAARIGGAVMLPSAVPRAVAAVGGGPLMRGITGAGVAGVEGGVYGGINAATGPVDPVTREPITSIPAGILGGTVGGAVGQQVGQGVANLANRGVKAYRGVNDAAPLNSMTVLPTGRTPSPLDYVNVAAAKAEAVGARKGTAEAQQQAQRDNFDRLLTGKESKVIDPATGKASNRFTKTQQDRMRDIVKGDPGTRQAENAGDLLKNKLFLGGLGGGVGASTGLIPGLLAAGGSMGAGKALTLDSAKATQEAVDRLRQLMYKKTPFKGPMSPTRARTFGQGAGYGGMLAIEDYLGQ